MIARAKARDYGASTMIARAKARDYNDPTTTARPSPRGTSGDSGGPGTVTVGGIGAEFASSQPRQSTAEAQPQGQPSGPLPSVPHPPAPRSCHRETG